MPSSYEFKPTRDPNGAAPPPRAPLRYGRVEKVAKERPELPALPGGRLVAALVVAYVAAVLSVDTLATKGVQFGIDWRSFDWRPSDIAAALNTALPRFLFELLASPRANNFDLFKFTLWFVVPFLLCVWRMDWKAWGWGRWRWTDWLLLLLALVGGIAAVMIIPYVPALSQLYQYQTNLTVQQKLNAVLNYNLWCLSWLVGWEFLHRYLLLAALGKFLPRGGWGWLIVPLLIASSEAAYHLVKPWPEMLGMFAFGFLASLWAYQRSNWLLPLVAHWFIEMSLIIFLVVFG